MEIEGVKKFDVNDFDLSRKVKIGQGAYATTYKVHFKNDLAVCALKKAHDRRNSQNSIDETKEIAILYDVRHGNIIPLFGTMNWSNKLCLVMEYASHGTVYDQLYDSEVPVPIDMTDEFKANTIRDVCNGLEHLHTGLSKPIRHGDIKSPNVLLCSSDNEIVAKIADFGLSDELTKTKTGDGKCSYRWAAPEILAPTNLQHAKIIKSIKSDIWSLGAFAWEIWMNKLPYSNTLSSGSGLDAQIIFNVGAKKLTPYNPDTDSDVPEFYRAFLLNCFEFDHGKRWSIKDVCEYLKPARCSPEVEDMDVEESGSSRLCLDSSVRTKSEIPIEIRNRYSKACFHLTKVLSQDANFFTTVKNLFRVEIARGTMERIKSPDEFIDCLERQALISVMNTSILETRLRMIGEEGERLANFFCPGSPTLQPKAMEEMMASGASSDSANEAQLRAALAVQEIARPPRRSLKDNDSPLEKLMSDMIALESKPGLKKMDKMLERLQPKEEKPDS